MSPGRLPHTVSLPPAQPSVLAAQSGPRYLTWRRRDLPDTEGGQLQIRAASWALRAVGAIRGNTPYLSSHERGCPFLGQNRSPQTRSSWEPRPRRPHMCPGGEARETVCARARGSFQLPAVPPVLSCQPSEWSSDLGAPAGCRKTERHSRF